MLACTSAGCMPAGVESPVICRAATAGSRPSLPGARPGRPLRRPWPARSGYLPGQAVAVQAGDRAAVSAGEPGVAAHSASCLCGVWFRTVPQSDRISFAGLSLSTRRRRRRHHLRFCQTCPPPHWYLLVPAPGLTTNFRPSWFPATNSTQWEGQTTKETIGRIEPFSPQVVLKWQSSQACNPSFLLRTDQGGCNGSKLLESISMMH